MIFDTIYYELLLKIRTVGQDYRRRDDRNFGYDPTPYSVLSKLAASGYIKENDTLIDYGCGKGRVGFFLAHKCHCKVIGIDYNEAILKIASDNKERNGSENVTFIQGKAQDYKVTEADCAFFFNPFSVEILIDVLNNLTKYCRRHQRKMLLFFYYPSKNYRRKLKQLKSLKLLEEIDCTDIFLYNSRVQRILVYELS